MLAGCDPRMHVALEKDFNGTVDYGCIEKRFAPLRRMWDEARSRRMGMSRVGLNAGSQSPSLPKS